MSFTRKSNTVSTVTQSNEVSMADMNLGKASLSIVVTGTITATLQFTLGDDVWFDHDVLVDITANTVSNIVLPVAAIRLNVTAESTGTAYLQAVGV